MVGSRLSQNEEYVKAVKDHILGMIVTTRVQFLIPDCLKPYIGGCISRLATLGTRWDMHASRRILLRHFDVRAVEYRDEMVSGDVNSNQANSENTNQPNSVLRQRWSYQEVLGELMLLLSAFIHTTSYALYGALAELARRPEYLIPLREEIEAVFAQSGATVEACDKMVLLDSFLKECQRLYPPAVGITLRSGTHVGVPSGLIQRSSIYYTNPDTFDGFRFVNLAAAGAKSTRLVDLSPDYLVFEMGIHAW
ncbi:Cytochrome P450 monooxygenase paxQ [Cladobotryum mycophilum]|uniref:Cytochrome P450 monooxygenase paxQ n=1 Tax=Cladobotryum mycophilum TaxID=491253 RepID=A0ABR0STG4_9HYPO